MIVYIVTEEVDLGYHNISVHSSEDEAKEVARVNNIKYHQLYGGSGKTTPYFYVEEHEVI